MIVTLAGHVDHGKTAIVKALTGIDTDRLAEEQTRGLTIDLGFAYTDFDDHRIGFVDVPGHQSFIHNMIAGVAHMQHALLVVAADDGVMPQTKEHLQILQLLGLEHGTVVLNKVDAVDEIQLQQITLEIRNFLNPTFLSSRPIIEVSATAGTGINDLRSSLAALAGQFNQRRDARAFRLAIDRVFSRQGLGTIVTGTIYDGELQEGDEVYLTSLQKCVRVRRLVANGLPTDVARTGERCGAQISGASSKEITRGDWLRDPKTIASTNNFTIQFELAADFSRDIKSWCRIHVYHGTSHRLGQLFLLGGALNPGSNTIVDIVVADALHVAVGDRVIVRDQGLDTTMGGGIVIATNAPTTRRRLPARIQHLRNMASAVEKNAPNRALLQSSTLKCVNGDEFRSQWNLTEGQFNSIVNRSTTQQVKNRFLDKTTLQTVRTQIENVLDKHHETSSNEFGLTISQLAKKTSRDSETVRFVLTHGRNTAIFQAKAGQYATTSRINVQVSYNKQLYKNLLPLIAIRQPYPVGDLARELKVPLRILENELKRMLKAKLFVQVSDKRYFTENRLQELANLASVLSESGPFTVKNFRDQSEMGRMVCIEVLEYFDKIRYTRRESDTRRVISKFDL